MTTMNLVEQIVKHPAVSRVYSNACKIELLTDNLSLQALCRLRRMRGNSKRAIQNAKEDVLATGFTTSVAAMPRTSLERECLLTAYGRRTLDLPSDLAELVQAAVEAK
jgi:hypothetical protein